MTPDIVARRIGREQQPVVVIDGFHPDPESLRAQALAATFGPARRHYPGIRAPLPPAYFAAVRPALGPVLRDVFGHAAIDLLDTSFSIVTADPDTLSREQRLPHVDAVEAGRIALVHYLSPEGGAAQSGTAFYRHRATGFEAIDATRAPAYFAALEGELRESPPPAAYPDGDTAQFERIALIEPRFNRAIVYRSALLHSGAIPPGAALDPDPARGRLTVTAFLAG